jgi:hypothetical protein
MAGALFDLLQNAVFDASLAVFGYTAIWVPANGAPAHTEMVHFRAATDDEQLAGPAGYSEPQWQMEFKAGQFPGLRESVDAAQVIEIVTISGHQYDVRAITASYDGKTLTAMLNPHV